MLHNLVIVFHKRPAAHGVVRCGFVEMVRKQENFEGSCSQLSLRCDELQDPKLSGAGIFFPDFHGLDGNAGNL